MGTSGLYGFKLRGRYYLYYSRWYVHYIYSKPHSRPLTKHRDSYPEGLGKILTSTIPSEPAEYRRWLEARRAEYSCIVARLAPLYALSWSQAENGETKPMAAAGVEFLEG